MGEILRIPKILDKRLEEYAKRLGITKRTAIMRTLKSAFSEKAVVRNLKSSSSWTKRGTSVPLSEDPNFAKLIGSDTSPGKRPGTNSEVRRVIRSRVSRVSPNQRE